MCCSVVTVHGLLPTLQLLLSLPCSVRYHILPFLQFPQVSGKAFTIWYCGLVCCSVVTVHGLLPTLQLLPSPPHSCVVRYCVLLFLQFLHVSGKAGQCVMWIYMYVCVNLHCFSKCVGPAYVLVRMCVCVFVCLCACMCPR